jgi:hypothetical protein
MTLDEQLQAVVSMRLKSRDEATKLKILNQKFRKSLDEHGEGDLERISI